MACKPSLVQTFACVKRERALSHGKGPYQRDRLWGDAGAAREAQHLQQRQARQEAAAHAVAAHQLQRAQAAAWQAPQRRVADAAAAAQLEAAQLRVLLQHLRAAGALPRHF
jgi:hypothetical protein